MQEERKVKVTLSDFIEDNYKLLSVLGILTALTIFSGNLTPRAIGSVLSLAFLSEAVLVWLELWAKFPRKGSLRLVFFENILSLIIMTVIAYWLIELQKMSYSLIFYLTFLVILYCFSMIIKKFNVFELFFPQRKIFRYIFGFIIIWVVWVLSSYFAEYLTPFVNTSIEELRQSMELPK